MPYLPPLHTTYTSPLLPSPTTRARPLAVDNNAFRLPPLVLGEVDPLLEKVKGWSTVKTGSLQREQEEQEERDRLEVQDALADLNAFGEEDSEEHSGDEEDVWKSAAGGFAPQVPPARVLSWDSVNGSTASEYRSPFFSEATTAVWEAELLTNTSISSRSPTHSRATLILNLFDVVLGLESQLFAWDKSAERFVWREELKGKRKEGQGRLFGASAEVSQSLVAPFLEIGTLLVRLDNIISTLSSSTSGSNKPTSKSTAALQPSKTSHAVAASLATFLAFARSSLSTLRPPSPSAQVGLLSTSTRLAPLLAAMRSLATLFAVPLSATLPISPIPLSTPLLLTRLHNHLQNQLDYALTPPLIEQAVAAWLFDGALREWWKGWEEWVGVLEGGDAANGKRRWEELGIEESASKSRKEDVFGREEMVEGEERDVKYTLHLSQLPKLLPRPVAVELFEAGRALRLLRRAKPDHPLCQTYTIEGSGGGLLWQEGAADEYHAAVLARVKVLRKGIASWRLGNIVPATSTTAQDNGTAKAEPPVDLTPSKYPTELASLFRLFDLAPGADPTNAESIESSPWTAYDDQYTTMLFFIARIVSSPSPDTRLTILPASSPSLSVHLLTSLFTPLRSYARLPSTSLLSLFFTDFSLPTHLNILSSFFLLSDASFVDRLRSSLFAPIEERGFTRRRQRDEKVYGKRVTEKEVDGYGIGIGIRGTTERGVWPPGGAELSLALRTTLEESLVEKVERVKRSEGEEDKGRRVKEVWRDVESRLSFAYRHEEVVDDPHSLAALDFLYLDYKPPAPLDLVISPSILAKYQRIFSHLLRLIRVDSVARHIWLDVSKPNVPATRVGRVAPSTTDNPSPSFSYLFKSKPVTRRALLALAFEVRGIVQSLSSFAFAGAVEQNWHMFEKALARVAKVGARSRSRSDSGEGVDEDQEEEEAWNLDSLESLHQHCLDRIQQALLLKRSQAPLLRVIEEGIFGAVLMLGRRIRVWRRGEEIDGALGEIKVLREKLQGQASMLVKVLQALDDRGSTGKRASTESSALPKELDVPLERGASFVQELLVKLDSNRFYSSRDDTR